MEKIKNKKVLLIVYIVFAIAFILPSLIYIIKGKDIINLNCDFSFFFANPTKVLSTQKIISTIAYVTIFTGLSIAYYLIIKYNKTIFISGEQVAKFILIISTIFFMMLPFTSTDIFYYMATGRSEAKYGVNPYYTSVAQLMQNEEYKEEASTDEILKKMPQVWKKTTIVYGPVWPLICKILSMISMGNLSFSLFIYKLFNLTLHLLNCYLIYKISNKKKIFALIYGLNPMVLLEGIVNVHNDMLSIFFILAALFFFIKKKKIVPAIILLSVATAVKYYAILLVPFLVIYYYRKEKISKRILYSLGLAIIFVAVLIVCYLFYMQDLDVLKGIAVQQGKYAGSIFLIMFLNISPKFANLATKGFTLAFIVIYLYNIIKLLFTKKEISLTKNMRIYNSLLILFIFGTITNLHSWYIMWILPTIPWQTSKTIKNIINITTASQIAYWIFFLFSEAYTYSQYYWLTMMFVILFMCIIGSIKSKKKEGLECKNQ